MVNLSWVSGIISHLYSDSLTVYRYTVTKDEFGVSRSSKSETPIRSNIPCYVAFDKTDDSTTNEVSNIPLSMGLKVFVGIDCGIRAGDSLVVTKNGDKGPYKTYKGLAGEPKAYPTHYQIILLLDEANND